MTAMMVRVPQEGQYGLGMSFAESQYDRRELMNAVSDNDAAGDVALKHRDPMFVSHLNEQGASEVVLHSSWSGW